MLARCCAAVRFDLLHFSGHGAARRSDDILDASSCSRDASGAAPWSRSSSTSTDGQRERAAGPARARRDRSWCSTPARPVARGSAHHGGGFANAFLDAGASAFVSCLWSVHQQPSRVFVEKLYDELLDGTPMAAATASAREAAREQGDATWLAFVVYARPDAVLARS